MKFTGQIRERPLDYNGLKRTWCLFVVAAARRARLPLGLGPVAIRFWWMEPNRKRDPDNVCAGGRKLILDGLVQAGVLLSDRAEHITGFSDGFLYPPEGHGVELEIIREEGRASESVCSLLLLSVLPDLNALLAAREVGARKSVYRRNRAVRR